VTIDLVKLDHVEVIDDETARVGPGNRWGPVYKTLESAGKMVLGGRVSEVGVGGFLLGGGIAFTSRQHGWAMDSIRSYEIVLANGTIVNADQQSHPDLYWALRGGGSNFGVVTDFTLETYPRTDVWGGQNIYIFGGMAERRARLGIKRPFEFSLLQLTQTAGRIGGM